VISLVLFNFVAELRERADVSNVVAASTKDALLQKGVGKSKNRLKQIRSCFTTHTHTHTHTRLTALFRDYPGDPVSES